MRMEQPTPGRLESFSDGVIAVIITILVLDLKVPHTGGWAALVALAPTLAVYLLSFAFTGIYWINHHHSLLPLKHVDAPILHANLGFLFCLSLLPFFTDFLMQKHMDADSTAIYAASLLLSALSFRLLGMAIGRNQRLAGRELDEREQAFEHAGRKKGTISLICYALAVGLAFWRPWVAVADVALVTLIWVIPNFLVVPAAECRAGLAGNTLDGHGSGVL